MRLLENNRLMAHGTHPVGHDRRRCDGGRIARDDGEIADGDVADGRFGKAKKSAGRMGEIADFDILHGNAVDKGRAAIDRRRLSRLHPVIMSIGITMVMGIGGKRGLHAIQQHPAHGDVADCSAPPAPCLEAQAAIRADHVAILDRHVMHTAGHFRTDHQPAMAALHQAMAHPNAARFREMIVLAIGAALSRLHRDAIVADGKAHA